MTSSRAVITVLVFLGIAIQGYEASFKIGHPYRTISSVAESTINSAQMGLQLMDLKLHIDQSIEYLWDKFHTLLEELREAQDVSCGKGIQKDISILKEKLIELPNIHDNLDPECSNEDIDRLRTEVLDELKAVREGQMHVSERLGNVSSSREIKVARLEHQLREIALNTQVYMQNPDGKTNGSFFVKTTRAANHAYGDDWIIFQQRYDGTVDFYRNWTEYRAGFGDIGGEFWLGLDKLYRILSSGPRYELLIELEDFQGVTAYEHYDDFLIGDEGENYVLKTLGKDTGTAGNSLAIHKGMNFSTYDHKTNDCPTFYHGAWWFLQCYDAHLNAKYLIGKQSTRGGIIWHTFRGSFESLQATKMMVRPLRLIDRVEPIEP
ncbi:fibrinogen C domain-containing protein 1-like [Anopheles funestus]|uniref:Fibrinogen C-terminal domain-containing protein n=1 Tax=Anopheles funestus TaxID=62324 RepID=A0A182RGI4_ANOFN|nr:fibrinogen C domain-containing protein 1-like [Anopheles funestus]